MQKRTLEIKCPNCGSSILVDIFTGKILRHLEKGKDKVDESLFDKTMEKIAERKKNAGRIFNSAKDQVKGRGKALEDAFDSAKKKAKEKGKLDDESRPEHPLDWD